MFLHFLKIFFISLFLLHLPQLASSTPEHIPSEPVSGPPWSIFSVYGKDFNFMDVQEICSESGFKLKYPKKDSNVFLGCSMFSFALKQCHFVYVTGNVHAREHEKLHCSGMDHPDGPFIGEKSLSLSWHLWKHKALKESERLYKIGIHTGHIPHLIIQRLLQLDTDYLRTKNFPINDDEADELKWEIVR